MFIVKFLRLYFKTFLSVQVPHGHALLREGEVKCGGLAAAETP